MLTSFIMLESNLSWEGQLMGTRENSDWSWMGGMKSKLTVGLQVGWKVQDGRMPQEDVLLL